MKRELLVIVFVFCLAAALMAQNPRNVVVYDITSTDCGHCSCLDSLFRVTIMPAYPQTIPLAFHSPLNSAFSQYQGNVLCFTFNAYFAPAAYIDGLGNAIMWGKAFDSVADRYAESPEAPVLIEVDAIQWESLSREVTLTATMTNLGAEMPGNYRCQLFITENNIKAMHRTEIGCSTPDNPIGLPFREDYFNDHVIRKVEILPDSATTHPAWGDSLIGPTWPGGQAETRTWTVAIDTGWVEENCFLNIVVYHDADSLYKSEIKQAIAQSVTGAIGIDQLYGETQTNGIALIYPNPATDWVNFHLSIAEAGQYSLELLDINGRVVETLLQHFVPVGLFNVEYNASGLPAGTYLCRLRTMGWESVERLVVK